MDSFSSDKSDSGVLVPPRPVVYGNMVCPLETSRDGDDASPSVTPALPCDHSVTHLAPPLSRTSDQVLTQDQGIKDDVSHPFASSTQSITTKVSTPSMATGNMNQMCKVCGEPAAGFHFGAFTCEGCKSFFGRTYNNLSSLNECKNSGRCVINKKTRTSCKSCRLRKCLMVGMSKSGSRYGRRSNWFKIHYLMQGNNNNNNNNNENSNNNNSLSPIPSVTTGGDLSTNDHSVTVSYTPSSPGLSSPASESKTLSPDFRDFKITPDFKLCPDFKLSPDFKLGADLKDCKGLNSPTPSSSESHNSDSSLDLSEKSLFPPYPEHLYPKELLALYNLPALTPHLPPYMSPTSLAHRYLYPYYPSLLSVYSRRQYLDSLLQKARQSEASNTIDVEDEPRDLASPNREFTPPTKFFKPNTIRPHDLKVAVKSRHSPVRGLLSLRQELNGRDPLPGYNPGHDLTPRGSPDTVPIAATAPQDLPIDLSVKNKSPSPQRIDSDDDRSASSSPHIIEDEDREDTDDVEEVEKDEERKKEEQETPLDLSSVRMG